MPYNNSQEGYNSRRPSQRRPSQPPPRGGSSPQRAPSDPPPNRRPPNSTRKQPSAPKIENRWFRAIVMVIATIVGCVFLAFFVLQSANDLFGLNQVDKSFEIEIPKGSSNADVAAILKSTGVVDQQITFTVYAGLKTKEKPLQAGNYVFNSNMSYDEIISALRSGNSVKEQVRLTFYERDTVWDIANKLQKGKVCNAQEFVDYLNNAELDYEFMNAMPNDKLRYHRLEGYLFPDTYDFFIGENVAEVAKKFLNNFNNKVTDELQQQMQELNLTLDEAITLASIIQREADNRDDMHHVSSIFHNRMDNEGTYPRLQSDVTIFYVNTDIKPYLQQTDQDMYDAYNTYVRSGLPVGPICNPGMDAIKAALHPSETGDYFFVTDKNGFFYYAVTASEHNKNVLTAKAVGGEAHGVDTSP